MKLSFFKMQGAGNDFVVLDALRQPLPDNFDFARAAIFLCDRHRGIGGDGLLLLESSATATVRKRMWNPDGSEDMCGNGLRCIALLAHQNGHVAEAEFVVQTLAGKRAVQVLAANNIATIRTAMGAPQFAFSQIPVRPDADFQPHILDQASGAFEYELKLDGAHWPHAMSLSTGSTHTAIFVDELPDDATFRHFSPLIENHRWFPERTTVLWAKVQTPRQIAVRIWERGVGETLACGTGACAVAVAAQISQRCENGVSVQSRGGNLRVDWQHGQPMFLTGPAQTVFGGTLLYHD